MKQKLFTLLSLLVICTMVSAQVPTPKTIVESFAQQKLEPKGYPAQEKNGYEPQSARTAVRAPRKATTGDEEATTCTITWTKDGETTTKTATSLANAVKEAPTDGTVATITMTDDEAATAQATITAKQNIILELNGYVISCDQSITSSFAVIANCGTLTIQDNTDTQKNGTGTGKITSVAYDPDMTEVPGYASNTITNYGHLTVLSGFIESGSTGKAAFAIDNEAQDAYWQTTVDKIVSLTITGGKFRSGQSTTIRQYLRTDGTIDNVISISNADMGSLWVQDNDGATAAKGSLTIDNTTFAYNLSIGYYCVAQNYACSITNSTLQGFSYYFPITDNNTLTFSGNTVHGAVELDYPRKFISDGTFNNNAYFQWTYYNYAYIYDDGTVVFLKWDGSQYQGYSYNAPLDKKSGWENAGYKFVVYSGHYYKTYYRAKLSSDYIADGYYTIDSKVITTGGYVDVVRPQQTQTTETYTIDETQASTISESSTEELQKAKTAVETNTLNNASVAEYATNVKASVNAATQATIGTSKNYVDVKLTAAVTSSTEFTTGSTTIVKEMTFDVKPVYVTVDGDGNETENPIPNSAIESGITFRLPVNKDVTAIAVHAYHINEDATEDNLGYKPILGDAENGKYIEITSSTFSNFRYTLQSNTDVKGTVYTYDNQDGIENQTLAQFATTRETYPNAVMIVSDAYEYLVADQTNVIVKYTDEAGTTVLGYVCPNFVLTDLSEWGVGSMYNGLYTKAAQTGFYNPVESFTATKGSCTRSFYKGYNSACFPFAIASDDFNAYELLNFSSFNEDAGKVYFKYSNNGVNAGTPVIIKLSADKDVTVSWNSTETGSRTIVQSTLTGYCYKGVFTATDEYKTNYYSVDEEGGFSPLTSYIYPFRACFSLKGGTDGKETISGGNARKFTLAIEGEDDTTTGISEVQNSSNGSNGSMFNLAGQKVSNMNGKGLYIINGKKVIK